MGVKKKSSSDDKKSKRSVKRANEQQQNKIISNDMDSYNSTINDLYGFDEDTSEFTSTNTNINDELITLRVDKEEKGLIFYDEDYTIIKNKGIKLFPPQWGITPITKDKNGNIVPVSKDSKTAQRLTLLMSMVKQERDYTHSAYQFVPMICRGLKCCYRGCAYFRDGLLDPSEYELDKYCLYEMSIISNLVDKFNKMLNIKQGDPRHIVDELTIKDIVTIEILLNRVSAYLEGTDVVIMKTIGADKQGNPIDSEAINDALVVRERLIANKLKLLSSLKATRESINDNEEVTEQEMFDLIEQTVKEGR